MYTLRCETLPHDLDLTRIKGLISRRLRVLATGTITLIWITLQLSTS
jgi:hypothetical protein